MKTIVLRVSREMIQNIKETSGTSWVIKKDSDNYLSNKFRNVYKMILTGDEHVLKVVLSRLDIAWKDFSETRVVDFFNYGFEKRRYGKLPCVLVWNKKRGYHLQRRNIAVTYQSVYAGGNHYVNMSHILSY